MRRFRFALLIAFTAVGGVSARFYEDADPLPEVGVMVVMIQEDLLPHSLGAGLFFDPHSPHNSAVAQGFPEGANPDCATWENGGLRWHYRTKWMGKTLWGVWVSRPDYRYCGLPTPFPPKPEGI